MTTSRRVQLSAQCRRVAVRTGPAYSRQRRSNRALLVRKARRPVRPRRYPRRREIAMARNTAGVIVLATALLLALPGRPAVPAEAVARPAAAKATGEVSFPISCGQA